MAGYEGGSERMWDEYDWERFLQEQDRKTEKYMQLVETFLDDPQRDEIIAGEMGWTQLLGAKDWSAEVDALFDEDGEQNDDLDADGASLAAATFEEHHLYQAAFALTIWIDELFDQKPSLQNEPAAALSGDDVDEIGMTIAYLKRALKAITISMNAAAQLLSEKLLNGTQHSVLQQRLFQVRVGIITLMGEYRAEWRRRFGSEGYCR